MILSWCQVFIHLSWFPWLIWSLEYYHMKSMKTFKPPEILRNDSYFGFSVTYDQLHKRLIVSAPRANETGRIYSCDIDQKAECKPVNTPTISREYTDYDHDYWLGATVAGGKNIYVTCAPRQVRRSKSYSIPGEFATCYKSVEKDDTLVALSTATAKDKEPFDKLEAEMDSFGWSITVSETGSMLIGGPAMNHGLVMRYNNENSAPQIKRNDNNYNFGYSVAIMKYKRSQGYVIGSTYGTHGEGSVTIYVQTSRKIEDIVNLPKGKDERMVGTMYGAALCAARLSTDNDALLVGAPAFALHREYDVGAVYVYSPGLLGLRFKRRIKGYNKGSFFGSAIASVGDLNGDGNDDIVIAAPYEDDGTGAVYLYCGAKIQSPEASIKELQRIQPKEFKMFGLSVSALRDYDENGCNELVIGAPGVDRAAVLHCMAAVTVQLRAELPMLQKRNIPGASKPPLFMNETYANFKSCMDVIYPKRPEEIEAKIRVKVELTHRSAKLDTTEKDGSYFYIVSLDTKQKEYCQMVGIILPKDGHYDMKLSYVIAATLLDNPVNDINFKPSKVVLSERSKLTVSGSAWAAECKNESACEPKLTLRIISDKEYSLTNKYLIGSTDVMPISLTIKNDGEPAYSSCVALYTEGVPIRSLPATNCARKAGEANHIQCEPPMALNNGDIWNTQTIELDTSQLTSMDEKFTIHTQLYDNCGIEGKSVPLNISIGLEKESAGITVIGITPNYVNNTVNVSSIELSNSKLFEHKYSFINNGVTNWKQVSCEVTLKKSPYIEKYNFYVQDGNCSTTIETEEYWQAICEIDKIYKKRSDNDLHIFIILEGSDDLVKVLRNENLMIQSNIVLHLGERSIEESVVSTIKLEVREVPLWVIICAIIVGLLILILIAMILREVGLLKRQNRKKLEDLRKSIRRQTIRRSMAAEERQRVISQACKAIEVDSNDELVDKDNTENQKRKLEHKIMDEIRCKNLIKESNNS